MKSQILFYRFIFLLPTLLLGFLVKANNFSNNKITIDESFISGQLGNTIISTHSNLLEIKYLIIKTGTVNNTDIYWVRENLTELLGLSVLQDAKVENNTLPESAFLNFKSI